MMYKHIYQNSYIVAIITFVILCVIFYFLQIGYSNKIANGKVIKKFSWKYPLAITLMVWLIWHFYLYPPIKLPHNTKSDTYQTSFIRSEKLADQKIIMNNWN